jgi:hypothetical protein
MTSWLDEVWKDIPGWEGLYQVSNKGRIRSIRVRVTKPYDARGYKVATLRSGERLERAGVHRFVALAFLPNPDRKEQVNHKNGDRSDNSVENLEWVTCQENNLHRCRVLNGGGGRPERPVVCLTTGEWFPSVTKAADATGSQICKIVMCCQGKRRSHKGLSWAYTEEVQTCVL